MLLVNSADPGAHLSLLRHWLPDVLLVLAKVSERTLVLNLQPRMRAALPLSGRHPGF
jgi:hypothetical protein